MIWVRLSPLNLNYLYLLAILSILDNVFIVFNDYDFFENNIGSGSEMELNGFKSLRFY